MNKFRKNLQKRICLCGIIIVLCGVILMLNRYVISDYFAVENSSFIIEFQSGLACGIIFLLCILIFKFRKALSNDDELKKLYNKENDERKKYIKQKCGGNVIIFISTCTIIAALIAGYFNLIIFYTLLACSMFQLTVCAILKFYYLRRN